MTRIAVVCLVLAVTGCGGGSKHGQPNGFGGATWSTRRGLLAYVAARRDEEPTAIYVMRPGDGLPLRVSPRGYNAWSPAWSPDGRWLAYTADRVPRGSLELRVDHLYLVSSDGRHRVRLTHTGDESSPSWSPDGRRLAYVRDGHIFVMSIAEHDGRQLTGGGDSEPQWSPNGRWIAYIHGGPGNGELILVHPNGTGTRRLPGSGLDCPRWSLRGDRIAFRQDGFVHVVDLGGGPTLAPFSAVADGYSCDYAWSPDGKALVFANITNASKWQVQMVELATFGVRTIATLVYNDASPELEPAWAPGPAIVIGGDTLRRLDPVTRSVRVLVSLVGP